MADDSYANKSGWRVLLPRKVRISNERKGNGYIDKFLEVVCAVGCTVPFSRFLCEETAISCCFHSKKHFCANHFQAVVNVPISLPFVRNSNLSGQKHTPARLTCRLHINKSHYLPI